MVALSTALNAIGYLVHINFSLVNFGAWAPVMHDSDSGIGIDSGISVFFAGIGTTLWNFPGIGTGIRIKRYPESCITDGHRWAHKPIESSHPDQIGVYLQYHGVYAADSRQHTECPHSIGSVIVAHAAKRM